MAAMRIVFDPDFASGAWPGPLRGGEASAGEEWCGRERLLGALETALGVPAPAASLAARAARLVPAVRATAGFWSASAALDPFGTARRLLEWRDLLALGGWRGATRVPRLAALGALAAQAPPGEPDRIHAILARLGRHDPGLGSLELFSPRDDVEPLWRALFAALERRGTRIVETALPPAPAPAGGDLAGARARPFVPRGDGSLRLLRPPGVLAAAEEVASWLATLPALDGTVVIGGDPALDAALRRHGLPTAGAGSALREDAPLQLLPLVLDLAWSPADPRSAFELLSLRSSPVPSPLRWKLRDALREWPAVDSDAWRAALAEGLAAIEDPEARARARERCDVLWDARTPRDAALPAAEIARRVGMLRAWLVRRRGAAGDQAREWGVAAAQCESLLDLVRDAGLEALAAPQLRRLALEAARAADPGAPFPAEAGLAAVGAPGAVCGPAERIVWWSFDETSVPGVPRLPLTREELADLESGDAELPDAARLAAAAARRWSRPLAQARTALLLVCPVRGSANDGLHPHPLWDEIVARVDAKNTRRTAEHALLRADLAEAVPRTPRAALPLPAPRRAWSVPAGRVAAPGHHSPTGLEALFGCPFGWALERVAGIRDPEPGGLGDGTDSTTLGRLLHAVLERLFAGPPRSPEDAERAAEALFRCEGPRLVAGLFMPGRDALRERACRAAARTARDLFALMQARDVRVTASERTLERAALGTTLQGRVDLVLGEPPLVLDLKWGGAARKRGALAEGTSIQLAAYSFLARSDDGPFPPVGYYVMEGQRLLTTEPGAFHGAETVAGPSPGETWGLVVATHGLEWRVVTEGRLEARGIVEGEDARPCKKAAVEDGHLVVPPACGWCSLGALCGRAFAEDG
jgi:ATP-dependent helicase/nuclease subunit B